MVLKAFFYDEEKEIKDVPQDYNEFVLMIGNAFAIQDVEKLIFEFTFDGQKYFLLENQETYNNLYQNNQNAKVYIYLDKEESNYYKMQKNENKIETEEDNKDINIVDELIYEEKENKIIAKKEEKKEKEEKEEKEEQNEKEEKEENDEKEEKEENEYQLLEEKEEKEENEYKLLEEKEEEDNIIEIKEDNNIKEDNKNNNIIETSQNNNIKEEKEEDVADNKYHIKIPEITDEMVKARIAKEVKQKMQQSRIKLEKEKKEKEKKEKEKKEKERKEKERKEKEKKKKEKELKKKEEKKPKKDFAGEIGHIINKRIEGFKKELINESTIKLSQIITESQIQLNKINLENKNEKQIQSLEQHPNISCSKCGMNPIIGNRYCCISCENVNFCDKCEEENGYEHGHPLYKFKLRLE